MKNPENIEKRVSGALGSLDGAHRATPGPFFFTRVQARLNNMENSIWESISSLLARPGIAIAGISLVILMNAIVLFKGEEGSPVLAEQSEQVFTEDYNMAINSFYENVNPEP